MNIYEKRLSRARTSMNAHGLDALILTPGAAMRYLTGFSEAGSRFLALIIPDDRPWLLVTPTLNAGQARENPAGIADIRVWDDAQGWDPLLMQLSKELMLEIGIVGLDDDMPARFALRLQEMMPTTLLKLAGTALSPLRALKDALELAALQHAAEATDALIPIAFAACREGESEMEIGLAIQVATARAGFSDSFAPSIGAGANGVIRAVVAQRGAGFHQHRHGVGFGGGGAGLRQRQRQHRAGVGGGAAQGHGRVLDAQGVRERERHVGAARALHLFDHTSEKEDEDDERHHEHEGGPVYLRRRP